MPPPTLPILMGYSGQEGRGEGLERSVQLRLLPRLRFWIWVWFIICNIGRYLIHTTTTAAHTRTPVPVLTRYRAPLPYAFLPGDLNGSLL